jgi:hypothetical protein
MISITFGGESGIRTHCTVRLIDEPLTSKADMTDRTNFAPETTSPERNEGDQSPTKINKINEAGFYPPAHNGQVAGSTPGPTSEIIRWLDVALDRRIRNAHVREVRQGKREIIRTKRRLGRVLKNRRTEIDWFRVVH